MASSLRATAIPRVQTTHPSCARPPSARPLPASARPACRPLAPLLHAPSCHVDRQRGRRVQAQVFDKLKGMLGGEQAKQPEADGVVEAEFEQDAEFENEEEGEEEGSTMVRIDSESRGIAGEGAFGPLAILLVGFMPDDLQAFTALMKEMEADMVKLIPCTKAMLAGTLQQALEVEEVPAYEQPPLGQRRALVLSGMFGGEVIEVVSAYREAGLPPAVFAAAVPNNFPRQVDGLIKEVYEDHNAMKMRAAQRQAEAELSS